MSNVVIVQLLFYIARLAPSAGVGIDCVSSTGFIGVLSAVVLGLGFSRFEIRRINVVFGGALSDKRRRKAAEEQLLNTLVFGRIRDIWQQPACSCHALGGGHVVAFLGH